MASVAKRSPQLPELVIGLVGAVGTDLGEVQSILERELKGLRYETVSIRLIHLLRAFQKWEKKIPQAPADRYITEGMNAGNAFRQLITRGDALVSLAIGKIRTYRKEKYGTEDHVSPATAYILRSLKNPAEVETLRAVYGESFILIAAYASHQSRLQHLVRRITESKSGFGEDENRAVAEELIQRDQEELGNVLGQNVRDTFHRADVFLDSSNRLKLEQSIVRFLRLFFGDNFKTPTPDEYCMFHARAGALRSSEMGRQVGAVIATEDGQILAIGTNEVPKAFGGFYWEGDDPDQRDFAIGYDSNDKHKQALLRDILKRLSDSKLLKRRFTQVEINRMVENAVAGLASPLLRGAQLMNLIEFGRAVHGEMASLMNAARMGVPVRDATMYVTTFPCHMCARHIVAAGIRRLVYIEPYAKSLAAQLYPDSISLDFELQSRDKIVCEPFVGVGPTIYMRLFAMAHRRKTRTGRPLLFKKSTARPRCLSYPASYVLEEKEVLAILRKRIEDLRLKLARDGGRAKARVAKRRARRGPARIKSDTGIPAAG